MIDMDADVSVGEQEPTAATASSSGSTSGSKKQQRIADLVKAQLRDQLKEELAEVLEARLEALAAERGDASEPDAPPELQVLDALQQAGLEHDPGVRRLLQQAQAGEPQAELRALADLASLALARITRIGGAGTARASRAIPPGGAGAPAPDLRAEYARRLAAVRAGDVSGLLEVKREFRKRGLEVY
ncbi:MAG: hypothetical protein KIS88_05850 [Anaerolineales bacterium]|nr:hypothetical protein [Anaerolineales bacterium]